MVHDVFMLRHLVQAVEKSLPKWSMLMDKLKR